MQSRFWTCWALILLAFVLGCAGDIHCLEQGSCEDECLACAAAVPSIVLSPGTQLVLIEPASQPAPARDVYADAQVTTPPPRA